MCARMSWQLPTERPVLAEHEVHVWRVDLDQPGQVLTHLEKTLSGQEKQRAQRFYFPTDRDHFVIAHGVLRSILGAYLNCAPQQVRFTVDRHGKPALWAQSNRPQIHFNLSHSHDLALVACSRRWLVGVDLEWMRDDLASFQIAERFFSAREVAMLRALPSGLRKEAFFNCWTRKEAYIKGKGLGLALPLNRFDVSIIPGEPAILVRTYEDEDEARRWSIQELFPGPGYAAALAVNGHAWRLKCWEWDARVTNLQGYRSIYEGQ